MTKQALIYAWTIIAIGTAVLAAAGLQWQSSNGAAFLMCLGLAVFASTFKVKLPGLTGTLSPGFVFVLVSVAPRSWSETVLIAVAAGIMQCLWRAHKRPTALQIAFNAATMAIAGGVAHGVTRSLIVKTGADTLALVLGAAGVALLLTNTLIVSTIICLIKEAPFYTVWRSIQLWAVPYYLAGGLLAGVWARTELNLSAAVTILSAGSIYLLSIWYHELSLRIQGYSTCAERFL